MNKIKKNIIKLIILLLLLIFALYYIFNNISSFQKLSLVSPALIIYLIILFGVSYICVAVYIRSLLKPFGIIIKVSESFMLAVATGFYNLITPFRGGMMIRAAYLKKKYKLSYTTFLSTLAGMYIIIFIVSGIIGLFSSLYIFNIIENYNWLIIGIFFIIILLMLLLIFFSGYIPKLKGRWLGKISKVFHGWNLIKNNQKIIFLVALFAIFQLTLIALMLILQFKVFGVEINFAGALILSSLTNLSLLISITPANLGIEEVIIVFSANAFGISPTVSLASALLGRAVKVIFLFILGPIFSYKLIKENKK
ncbi:MAG: lysylphosphatidylglycerol synthase transmembrane domain-containing protein [Patescibacteria group bacterium]|nr:lysylphosphatidylglycerol synthase transmembrane domain-containing protein [Patescibacteria group bacterium]